MKFTILVFFLMITSCAGIMLKDLNRVKSGMSQSQVKEVLGEPLSKKLIEGKEIFEYELKDDRGDLMPRIVVFQDREVVYFGKPSEYKANSSSSQNTGSGNHNTNTNTVSPTINVTAPNVTINPVINIAPTDSSKTETQRKPSSGSTYFHSVPTVNELKNNGTEPN